MAESGDLRRWARNRYWREADAQAVLDAWRRSGEPVAMFARHHGIQRSRLKRWARRLGLSGSTLRFHPVRVVTGPPERAAAGGPIEVQLVTGHSIRVAPGFDPEDLRRVLAVLGQITGC